MMAMSSPPIGNSCRETTHSPGNAPSLDSNTGIDQISDSSVYLSAAKSSFLEGIVIDNYQLSCKNRELRRRLDEGQRRDDERSLELCSKVNELLSTREFDQQRADTFRQDLATQRSEITEMRAALQSIYQSRMYTAAAQSSKSADTPASRPLGCRKEMVAEVAKQCAPSIQSSLSQRRYNAALRSVFGECNNSTRGAIGKRRPRLRRRQRSDEKGGTRPPWVRYWAPSYSAIDETAAKIVRDDLLRAIRDTAHARTCDTAAFIALADATLEVERTMGLVPKLHRASSETDSSRPGVTMPDTVGTLALASRRSYSPPVPESIASLDEMLAANLENGTEVCDESVSVSGSATTELDAILADCIDDDAPRQLEVLLQLLKQQQEIEHELSVENRRLRSDGRRYCAAIEQFGICVASAENFCVANEADGREGVDDLIGDVLGSEIGVPEKVVVVEQLLTKQEEIERALEEDNLILGQSVERLAQTLEALRSKRAMEQMMLNVE